MTFLYTLCVQEKKKNSDQIDLWNGNLDYTANLNNTFSNITTNLILLNLNNLKPVYNMSNFFLKGSLVHEVPVSCLCLPYFPLYIQDFKNLIDLCAERIIIIAAAFIRKCINKDSF